MMSTLTYAVAFLLIAGTATDPKSRPALTDKDREKEAARFAGEWIFQSVVYDGRKFDNLIVTAWSRLIISGNKYDDMFSHMAASTDEKGTFSIIEAGQDHVQVDVRVVEQQSTDRGTPPARNLHRKELWRLTDAKTFQRCFPNDHTGKRPKGFIPKKGDGTILMTYKKREK